MLGSHFDLAKEIKAIAAKRGDADHLASRPAKADLVFEDFDRRISVFLEKVAPILVGGDSGSDFEAPREDRG